MIEEALGAPLRIRILLALWEHGEINATELAHILGTNYAQLATHLKDLINYGLVEERRVGRVRLVKVRKDDVVISLIKALIVANEKIKQNQKILNKTNSQS